MFLSLEQELRRAVAEFVRQKWGRELENFAVETPPRPELGDFALPLAFELARRLRRPPRALAAEIAAELPRPASVARVEAAGAGYVNVFLDRGAVFASVLRAVGRGERDAGLRPSLGGKVIVEHTNINPNKAAHIGHLRNAALGDAFARLLRARGEQVEVQNYIDNTGVQVADVAVAFERLLGEGADAVAARVAAAEAARPAGDGAAAAARVGVAEVASGPPAAAGGRAAYSFDYFCWDLYARMSRHYEEHPESVAWRADALAAIEHGGNETARLAEVIADAIVGCHLRTMARLGVGYDLLPRESEILRLHFWQAAFDRLRATGAIRLETVGKNQGCWVMDSGPPTSGEEAEDGGGEAAAEAKVIVRSNGTVTYVGKDIAYQLWKFGLLGRDFFYRPWSEAPGAPWETTADAEEARPAPPFGHGRWVFNVIDARQSYLQDVVAAGLRALGETEAAERGVHFSYEMVALTPRCAEELGYPLSEEDRRRSHVEVSGRKGFGIKADDLMDHLLARATEEVAARHPELDAAGRGELARPIARGALRYFLLKFTKNALIAFDLREALSFDGESGPYVQYAAVRAANILRKAEAAGLDPAQWEPDDATGGATELLRDNGVWELLSLAARLESVVEQAITTTEPAFLAKHAFQLARAFNNFYHHWPVLAEADAGRRAALLALVSLTRDRLAAALDGLGIEVPSAM